jgi:hypothetical protein
VWADSAPEQGATFFFTLGDPIEDPDCEPERLSTAA